MAAQKNQSTSPIMSSNGLNLVLKCVMCILKCLFRYLLNLSKCEVSLNHSESVEKCFVIYV